MTVETPILPPQFADLEKWVADWALPTEAMRYDKRENSRYDDIKAFYDAMIPRAEEATAYLDTIPLDAFTDKDTSLIRLLFSLVTISFAVEIWKQPKMPDIGSAKLLSINEPVNI